MSSVVDKASRELLGEVARALGVVQPVGPVTAASALEAIAKVIRRRGQTITPQIKAALDGLMLALQADLTS